MLTETTSLGVVSYTYNAAGRRMSLAVSGQAPVSYTYDHNARLRTITQAPLTPVDIQYDAANRCTLLTLPNGVSTEYQYDGASRLAALIYRNALGPLGDLTYQYDAAGNRIATGGSFARTLVPTAIASSTYDAGNRQLAFGSNTQTFDANGNLLTQTDPSGTTTYTWDVQNRLVGITGPSVTASFVYDALGRRISKTINGTTTTFLYDGLDIVGESTGGSTATYLRTLSIDEALTRTDPGGTTAYLADVLGSTAALATGSGTLATTYTYEPFGRTEITGTPSPNSFRFTGREDDTTGLHYYRARYYDPTRSRFISEDPIGLAGRDLNTYAYVHANPLTATDPLGLAKVEKISKGAYDFLKVPRDLYHGGEHWHVYDRGTNNLLGRVSTDGKVVTGSVPGKALRLLKALGKIGVITGILLELATPCEAGETLEELESLLDDWWREYWDPQRLLKGY